MVQRNRPAPATAVENIAPAASDRSRSSDTELGAIDPRNVRSSSAFKGGASTLRISPPILSWGGLSAWRWITAAPWSTPNLSNGSKFIAYALLAVGITSAKLAAYHSSSVHAPYGFDELIDVIASATRPLARGGC